MRRVGDQTFGALPRGWRRRAGLTQEKLAERAEISARGLGYLEQGTHLPHIDTARRLAEALGLSTEEGAIFARTGTPPGPITSLPRAAPVAHSSEQERPADRPPSSPRAARRAVVVDREEVRRVDRSTLPSDAEYKDPFSNNFRFSAVVSREQRSLRVQ